MPSEMYPLSFPQQAIFLDAQLHGRISKFNMGGGIFIRGPLDPGLFRQAVEYAFRQHDCQRMRLHVAGGEARQEFVEAAECSFELQDYSGRLEPFPSAVRWVLEDIVRPMELDEFPLAKDILFRLSDGSHLWYPKFHHIANDAYGHAVVTATMAAAYDSLLARGRLPEGERHSYVDFILDDLAYAGSARFEEDAAFWRRKFTAMPDPLPFTTRKGGLTQDRLRTEHCTLGLNRLLYNAILKLCDEAGVTLFPFLLALLAAYLYRVTGRDELVIGTPIHNRRTRAFRATAGMFMNMIPVRVSVAPETTLLGLARQIAVELRSCFRHQRFPFGEVMRHCRTLEGFCHGVFDVTLVYRAADYDLAFGGSPARTVTLDCQMRDETLSVEVDEFNAEEDVNVFINYNPQLIAKEEVGQMAKAFETMLIDAVVVGDQAIAEVRLRNEGRPEEPHGETGPSERTVLDLLGRHAARAPRAVAVVDGATRMTYGELAAASDRVASFLLRRCDLEPEQPVAVLCDRRASWITALLGVMKAGGAYLPLDPDAPRERLAFILRDSGCRLLLAGEGHEGEVFPEVHAVPIGEAMEASVAAPARTVGARSLAYIIYTSGTTGQPNGVLVEHGGLANTALGQAQGWDLSPEDGLLQFAAPMFDASLAEIFAAFAAGARLVIAPKAVILDPSGFLELLGRDQVTVAVLPPVFLSALGRADLPSLRLLGTAGEAANPADAAHYSQILTYVNAYGPTECSICATFLKLEAGSRFTGDRVPIGKPLPHTEVRILDEQLRAMPVGAVGEICVGGVNVARGYLNRPELTRERFVPSPFREGERLYRTGDLGRWLPDGNIEFLGRRDLQVKIRGYRIELGEIETLLKNHPEVKTAAVLAVPGGDLAAYVVSRDGFDSAGLRRFLASRLPAYMVPSRWVQLPALPLNASGKVDAAALPPPLPAQAEDAEAPATELERSIAAIWEEDLACGAVSRHQDFFELGGHSLKAFTILSRIRRDLGVRVEMREFFEEPTVAHLAGLIETRRRGSQTGPEAGAGSPARAVRPDALSSLQERLWLVHHMDPAGTAYNMPLHLRIRGRLDSAALQEALRGLWRRHESLRSAYPAVDGRPTRVVLGEDALAIHTYDLPGDAWEAHYLAHHAGPFDLEAGPLLRVCLYRTAEEEHLLLLDIHHINGDGASLEVLRAELFELYDAQCEGRRPVLPLPGAGYQDYVADEAVWRDGPDFSPALEKRVRELTGAPARIDFQFDKPLSNAMSLRGGSVERSCGDLTPFERAFERGRGEGASPFMVVLAAYATMLHLQTGQEDLLIGIPTSLRREERFARTVGFFVNTCVARLDFSGSPTLGEIMKRTAMAVGDMLECPEVPLDHLVRALEAQRTPDRPPLVQAVLSFLGDDTPAPRAPRGLACEPVYPFRGTAMFELTLDVVLRDGRGVCALEYRADAWEEPSARRMLDQFFGILEAMADRPEATPDGICLPPPGLLEGAVLEAPVRLVPDWIRDHAERQPARPALVCGGVTTTYGQLDDLAARRRGQLAALDLPAGSVLALACDPGLGWTVTVLAAMAEGLVVVPLDPSAPVARLGAILEDSGAALLWHEGLLADTGGLPCPQLDGRQVPGADPRRDPCKIGPEATAYLLYTSGTTGRPKGVRVGHGAFERHCRSAISAFGLRAEDRGLVFAPPYFDASWEQLFAPLVAGASVLVRDAELWAPEDLCRRITAAEVTCADLPPQYLRELLFFLERRPECVPPSLRMVLSGGEAMPSQVAQAWLRGPLAHLPLINVYGPTEGVVTTTFHRIDREARLVTAGNTVPIGQPMPGRVLRILDGRGRAVAAGMAGELCLGGPCLADGYQGDAAPGAFRAWLTTPEGGRWADTGTPGSLRLYRSGDRVRIGPDGRLEFLGRIDRQIKVRGFRIEPGEVEARLAGHPAIAQALVVGRAHPAQGVQLVAYCIPSGTGRPSRNELAEWLSPFLPAYMIPAETVFLKAFPTTASGKIDPAALPEPASGHADRPAVRADGLEGKIAAIWAEVLGRSDVGRNENFFDLGGHSLLLVRVHTRLQAELGAGIRLVDLFAHPTVASLAELLRGAPRRPSVRGQRASRKDIAVVGMAGRFPGAANVDELWANLAAGREGIRFFTREELAAEGVPSSLSGRPDYVPASGYLEDAKGFDAAFFGYTPKEAEIIDPQQRLFLEEAWHALESAGYDPGRHAGDIAVFAGVGMNLYLMDNLGAQLRQAGSAEAYGISLSNDKDFITTRVSYKLDLRGPSVNVNTACSTSLVAIHLAAEALQRGECELALAGGVTLQFPQVRGYVYQPGGIASPDGHCRAFAEDAAGTLGGSGAAVVVLKRLDQALADGDTVHAVIKGSAVNNDGADKVGFTAPGLNRQRDVIRAALDSAGVGADSIGYVEAHGTGTPMGDPIEVQALCEAFAPDRPELQSCYIGSIKSNLGHMDTAAGAAGFVKAVLALERGLIPPSLHCGRPSTRIGFERTPFRVAQVLVPWPGQGPRRAGVSAFGMGGTNAHVVLEEAPAAGAVPSRQEVWCLPLSARTPKSLLASAASLARHLEAHPGLDATNLWFTLGEGRRRFQVRAALLAPSLAEAVAALRALGEGDLLVTDRDGRILSGVAEPKLVPGADCATFQGASAFARAWLAGQAGTETLLPAGPHRRIPLPTYAFDHEIYWVDPPEAVPQVEAAAGPVKLPVPAWFHFPGWERLPSLRGGTAEPVLILHGGSAAETRWMDALRAAGIPFAASPAGQIPDAASAPAQCWHFGALGLAPGGPADYARRLDALLADIRALAAAREGRPTTLLLLAPRPGGHDAPPTPAFAYLDAACAVVPHEYGNLEVKVLQVDPETVASPGALQAAARPGSGRTLALRGGRLWRRTFAPLPAGSAENGSARLRRGGAYLVTGGLGGVGLTLAGHLARACGARLALVARSAPDAAQREAIRAMEAAGAQVRTAALDVADAGALRAFMDDLEAHWGPLDGVIHAAGVPGGSLMARTALDELERVLRAKVAGTEALAAALAGRAPAFVLLCSSLTAVLGGPGQVAYAAANAWMDAFAAAQSVSRPGVWTSVQWDSWAEAGMAARAAMGVKPVSAARALLKEWRMTPASCWVWGEHRIGGVATLPGTAYLELFAQALGAVPCELGQVVLTEPMVQEGDDVRWVQVLREGDDLVLQSTDGTRVREHARARRRDPVPAPIPEPLAAVQARCMVPVEADGGRDGLVEAGPRWALEGELRKGQDEALARLELPPRFQGDWAEHPFHPALLDVALSHYLAGLADGAGLMPMRYERVRLFAPLAPVLFSHARLRSSTERSLVLDVDLRDPSGALLAQVEGYTLLRVGALAAPRQAQAAGGNPFAMTRAEGIETFLRVLDTAEPVVCVSTVAWEHAAKPAVVPAKDGSPGEEAAQETLRPRPELATAFRPPVTEAEKAMAAVWKEVLGFELGIDDDLLELGADSLTALQASARLKELTGSELAMDRFFAQATVANLAGGLRITAGAARPEAWEEGEL